MLNEDKLQQRASNQPAPKPPGRKAFSKQNAGLHYPEFPIQ